MLRCLLALGLAAMLVLGRLAVPGQDVSALSKWTGGVQLYRSGVFTTQKSWLWCTAADVQIMRNIDRGTTDHSATNQRKYFAYMRAHNRYAIPASDGVDPAGWTAGLRHFVDDRYRLVQSTSFESALRTSVTNLRKTGLPVAITVSRGGHAWIIVGFTATADPAVTSRFTVTSVRVVGSLWGLQSRTYGYDMKPNTKLTPKQLKTFFTPWHYAKVRMAYEGKWISVRPRLTAVSTTTTKASAQPATVTTTAGPSAAPIATERSTPSTSPTPTTASVTPPADDLIAIADPGTPSRPPPATPVDRSPPSNGSDATPAIAVSLTVIAVLALVGASTRRRYPKR
jgi:hypothetical protein